MTDIASIRSTTRAVLRAVSGGRGLMFLPLVSVFAYQAWGEAGLLVVAVAVPLVFCVVAVVRPRKDVTAVEDLAPLENESHFVANLDLVIGDGLLRGGTTACFVLIFDDLPALADRHGPLAIDRLIRRSGDRLRLTLRDGDGVTLLPGQGFAVSLTPVRHLDLEMAVQMAGRLQAAMTAPIVVDDLTLHPSLSVGFCLADRAPALQGASLLDAARAAADEALRHGPGALRAFQPDMTRRRSDRAELRAGLETALGDGQIRPWFQPQVSTDTGEITGFEALARWHHPVRGIIPPAEFLALAEEAGLSERLGEVMLYSALSALSRWDKAGHAIARVSVNFCSAELRNPRLPDRLLWELDRFALSPDRLTIEVLETVTAQSDDDVILSNLARIAQMGCGIDLDDFGTGQASIVNVRRFAIRRIKVDRCFVARCDTDPDQKRMVAAILSLCEHLGLETVAEGVETPGEHVTVAQLGCGHVQGFAIARPMALEDTFAWIARHERARQHATPFGQRR